MPKIEKKKYLKFVINDFIFNNAREKVESYLKKIYENYQGIKTTYEEKNNKQTPETIPQTSLAQFLIQIFNI